ncbi:mevalonate kinase [Amycolatopsis sp. NPDC051071]|uniref:mevalonate kinase n=1 Tax=Amycolatopsis sp. NPDC051071 TaxID=3154637 RepID=UPI0034247728
MTADERGHAVEPRDWAVPSCDRGDVPGVGKAHGKVILLGEHAVLYGVPALAVPVPQLTVTAKASHRGPLGVSPGGVSIGMSAPIEVPVEGPAQDGLRRVVSTFLTACGIGTDSPVELFIDCDIPSGRGLGSSAACARAVILALADLLGRRLAVTEVFDWVQIAENVTHGRASGVDTWATGAAGPLLFSAGVVEELSVGADGVIVIADSGVTARTKDAVESLSRAFRSKAQARVGFTERVSELVRSAVLDLADGRLDDLGVRLTCCHEVLRDVGVSTDRIDALVGTALAAGGLGAKITGGGLGGCMIALAEGMPQAQTVARELRKAGAAGTWTVPMRRSAGHA